MATTKSPKYSFKGWKLHIAIKKTLKEFLSVIVPAAATYWATTSPAWSIFAAAAGRFIIGVFDYWLSEY